MIDPATFRKAMSQYPTGVAVVAIASHDGARAMTIGSLTSVSLEPPLVLFCVGRMARLASLLTIDTRLSINVLRVEQQPLSTYFASGWKGEASPPHRFVPWAQTARLEGAAMSLAIRITSVAEGGDHLIIVGQVEAVHVGLAPIEPLIFLDRRYHGVDGRAGEAAPEIDPPGTPSQLFHDPWG